METIVSWLFGNAAAAVGTLALLALALVLWCRKRLPAALIPQRGVAIMIFCAAGLLLAMGMGAHGDELPRPGPVQARLGTGSFDAGMVQVLLRRD